jgi:hypothetical protein
MAPGSPAPAPAAVPSTGQPIELIGGKPYAIRVEHVGKTGQGKCEIYWQGKQMPRQAVPTTCLSPAMAWRMELAGLVKQTPQENSAAELLGPNGDSIKASLAAHDGGAAVSVNALLQPGLYRLLLPDSMREEFQELLLDDAVPVAVRPLPIESQLSVLEDKDLQTAKVHANVLLASSVEDMASHLTGQAAAGQRLWRYLAIAALLLAVAEIALARWISSQRMVGHEPVVQFTSELSPNGVLASAAFQRFAAPQGTRTS